MLGGIPFCSQQVIHIARQNIFSYLSCFGSSNLKWRFKITYLQTYSILMGGACLSIERLSFCSTSLSDTTSRWRRVQKSPTLQLGIRLPRSNLIITWPRANVNHVPCGHRWKKQVQSFASLWKKEKTRMLLLYLR